MVTQKIATTLRYMKKLITAAIVGFSLLAPSAANAAPVKECGGKHAAAYGNVTSRVFSCQEARLIAGRIFGMFPTKCYTYTSAGHVACAYWHSLNAKGDILVRVTARTFTNEYGCINLDVRAALRKHEHVVRFQTLWDCAG